MIRFLTAIAVLCGLAMPAGAVTVTLTGLGTNNSGVIGHAAVATSATAPGAAAYGAVGVALVYTQLATTDAWDATAGVEVPIGTNPPATGFGGTAPAPHGLEPAGITGDLHFGVSGLTLDFGNAADLFFTSATTETRFYRGGAAQILEETAPGVYSVLAEYTNVVMQIDIDYVAQTILSTTTATLVSGSSIFPENLTCPH
jgi:hypothetical protein